MTATIAANRGVEIREHVQLLELTRPRHRQQAGDGEFTFGTPVAKHGLILPVALIMVVRGAGALAFINPLHLLTFAVIALVCHRELAVDRPPVDRLSVQSE